MSSEVVDVLTGEVLSGDLIHELDESEARSLTDRIVHSTTLAAQLVAEAWQGRAWKALGYKSWESYADAELPMLGSNSSNRHVLLVGLRKVGMSTRAIAAATGLHHSTVARGVANATPETVTGTDGKQYDAAQPSKIRRSETIEFTGEATDREAVGVESEDVPSSPTFDPGEAAKVTERLTANMHPGEADAVADELGDGASPADIAEGMAEAIESREPAPITKPDLGGGVSHPARYSTNLIPIFADILDGYDHVLDPFAGTGRIHELPMHTVGVEIEPEWAALHPDTVEGSALDLPWADAEFDAVCTSPTYGNRLADSHNASDPERRRSYTHDLGRKLSADNSGAMQWGDEYREFHETAWAEAVRVLRPGGRFVLNIKDHIRGGVQQPVTAWHVAALVDLGMRYNAELSQGAPTGHLQQGSNSEARAGQELVLVFDKGVD